MAPVVLIIALVISYALLYCNCQGYGYTNKKSSFGARKRKEDYFLMALAFFVITPMAGVLVILEITNIQDFYGTLTISTLASVVIARLAFVEGREKSKPKNKFY